jgi:hypothetical protein
MDENEKADNSVPNLLKEIKILEEDVEMQAYINGLWVRHMTAIKELVNKEYPNSRLSDLINSSIQQSESWEDAFDWLENAKDSEQQFLEKSDDQMPPKSDDMQKVRAENHYLKGVIRALVSTRLSRLERILIGYIDWNRDLIDEIEDLILQSGLIYDDHESSQNEK